MKTIYKYPLYTTDRQSVPLPAGAEILSIQMQGSGPCLWAIVDTEAIAAPVRIVVVGTGHALPEQPLHFIATVQDGPYVWHVFREASPLGQAVDVTA